MWAILNGTIVNVITVAAGSGVGLAMGPRVPDRYQRIVLSCLGLVTVALGVDSAVIGMGQAVSRHGGGTSGYGARLAMVMIGSLIVGAIIGTALRLHDRIEGLGQAIHRRLGGPGSAEPGQGRRFAEAFLSASVIFCVGPLTLLGCLQNGAYGRPDLLYIKSCLDGFCSMALAASLGLGVAFSVLTVFFFQGSLALLAHAAARGLPDLSLDMMNVVGGVVLMATALMLLEIRRLPVADLLPGIFLPHLLIWITERVSPGLLILVRR